MVRVTLVAVLLLLCAGTAMADPVSFLPYNPSFTGGVKVAVCGPDYLGRHWLITAPGPGGGPHIRAFVLSADGSTIIDEPYGFFAYPSGFTGGVHISCAVRADGVIRLATGAGPGGGPHVITWVLP
jgi:hypothetical protein